MSDLNSINLKGGKYVIGVSGGVDSVVLLTVLSKKSDIELVVAHVDHGIREDSSADSEFVSALCNSLGIKFFATKLNLGPNSSEELARQKRYDFFHKIKQSSGANSIITAHHQDDMIETAFINLVRGTGTRGLCSLTSNDKFVRPLLGITKEQILKYANSNNINWHDDFTNADKKILRNKIRLDILPKMTSLERQAIINIIHNSEILNRDLDKELKNLMYRGLHKGKLVLSRRWFNYLPYDISTEVVRSLLLEAGANEIDKKAIDYVTVKLKTLSPGKTIQAAGVIITLTKRSARLKSNSKTDKKNI